MSKNYEQFASLYDDLMEEAPYTKWVEFVEAHLKEKPPTESSILELGGGTGTLAELLLAKGFRLVFSDYSPEMLAVTDQKLRRFGKAGEMPLYQLDMSDFSLDDTFDTVVIFCDALNYLPDETAVQATFQNVYAHLKPGGVFLFDVHSTLKIDRFLTQQTFGSSDPSLSYLWECFEGEAPYSVVHDLTFFIQEDNDLYRRIEETHEQRTYPLSFYLTLLEQMGFVENHVIGDFDTEQPLDKSERWIFKARK